MLKIFTINNFTKISRQILDKSAQNMDPLKKSLSLVLTKNVDTRSLQLEKFLSNLVTSFMPKKPVMRLQEESTIKEHA